MHRVGCRADDAVDLAAQVVDRPELRARRRVHAPRRRRRARQPVHRRAARALRRGARRAARARSADRHRARVQHRGRDRLARPRATTWCASASAATASRPPTSSKAASTLQPGDVGEGAGLAREDGARRARASRTGCATRPTGETRIATVPIGYADGVPRELPQHGGDGDRARPALPDGGNGHDGPAHARRRRPPGRGRRRGRADRPAGRRGDHRGRRGRARWAPSPTRSCAASGPASRGCTCREPAQRCREGRRRRASAPRAALAGAGYAGQRLLAAAAAAAGPTATRPARSTRRCTSTGGSTRSTAARSTRRVGRGPADRAVARRHQLDPHVVPPARRRCPTAGFRTIAFDHRGHGQSVVGTRRPLAREPRRRHAHRASKALDLRDAVLVGHSMGGVAVQAFVTQFPEIAAERVAGIVLLSTLAKTPFGSHSTRTKKRIEQITNRAPDMSWMWASPNLGLLLARLGFGRDPQPSHVELVRQMLRDVPARDAARRAARADRARPHRAISRTCASRRWSIVRHRRHAHAARAGAADRAS